MSLELKHSDRYGRAPSRSTSRNRSWCA